MSIIKNLAMIMFAGGVTLSFGGQTTISVPKALANALLKFPKALANALLKLNKGDVKEVGESSVNTAISTAVQQPQTRKIDEKLESIFNERMQNPNRSIQRNEFSIQYKYKNQNETYHNEYIIDDNDPEYGKIILWCRNGDKHLWKDDTANRTISFVGSNILTTLTIGIKKEQNGDNVITTIHCNASL